ncbi:MAG: 2-oxoacid:ferredoxin oxidoreductase subunit beta [Spirochaetia bacterium]|nr:2-oxoacid:ferredoxin oxidoreductase subunit beta [Spirochaetia bacterium]
MSTATTEFVAKDFKSDLKPIWCPGCGDFGVLTALYRALAEIGKAPHDLAFISGIGCSSRIPGYSTAYGFNAVHGRALPISLGVKTSNPDLTVIVASGDGDGFSIGGGHVPHIIRKNPDITFLVMDNFIYGLTKGQVSPTSGKGLKTVSTPYGSMEERVNPLLYTLSYGAKFVAQGTPADMKGLAKILEEAIRFPGFAFVNIQSPCVTYGEERDMIKGQKEYMKNLEEMNHDTSNKAKAIEIALEYGDSIHTGILYRDPNPGPSYTDLIKNLQEESKSKAVAKDKILEMFRPRLK